MRSAKKHICYKIIELIQKYFKLQIKSSYLLREKCPYSGSLWSAFSDIQFECQKIRARITPNMDTFYAVRFAQNSQVLKNPRKKLG